MNKFDLRKYFNFNILLETEYRFTSLAITKAHFNITEDVKTIERILNNLKEVSNIEPIKRTTEIKTLTKIVEEEDENGEIFYFKDQDEAIKFAVLLEENSINYHSHKHSWSV